MLSSLICDVSHEMTRAVRAWVFSDRWSAGCKPLRQQLYQRICRDSCLHVLVLCYAEVRNAINASPNSA